MADRGDKFGFQAVHLNLVGDISEDRDSAEELVAQDHLEFEGGNLQQLQRLLQALGVTVVANDPPLADAGVTGLVPLEEALDRVVLDGLAALRARLAAIQRFGPAKVKAARRSAGFTRSHCAWNRIGVTRSPNVR